MEYFVVYLVLGAIASVGIAMMNMKAGNWRGWGSVGYILAIMIPLWPVYAIYGGINLLRGTGRRCAWCGHLSDNDEEIKAHIRVCKLHPMRDEIESVEGKLWMLRHACNELIEYRRMNDLNFQLEKMDDFLRKIRIELEKHADS